MCKVAPLQTISVTLLGCITKESTVADNFVGVLGTRSSWFLGLETEFVLTNQQVIDRLLSLVQRLSLNGDCDRLVCLDGNDVFSVRVCYEKILSVRLRFFRKGVFHFDWSSVWLKSVPTKSHS